MEEDVLESPEEETKNNTGDNYKEPKKGNGLIIGLLILVIIGLVGFIVYDKFIKKDEPNGNDKPIVTPTPVITNTPEPTNNKIEEFSLEKKKISNKNTSYEMNGKTLNIRTYENSLYVNDIKVYTADIYDGSFEGYSIYINENSEYAFIEVEHDSICGNDYGYVDGALDSNGKFLDIEIQEMETHPDLPACSRSVYSKDGKYYATISGVDDANEKDFSYNVEYIIEK